MLRKVLSTIAVLLVMSFPVQAQERGDLAKDVLLLNGFDTLTEDQARSMHSAPASMREGQGPMAAAWERLAPRFFSPEPLFEAAVTELAERASAQELRDLHDFFATGLGERVTQLEEASQTPEMDGVNQVELGHGLLSDGITDERLAALQRLALAFGSAEENAAMSLNTQFVFQKALSDSMGGGIADADLLALILQGQDDLIERLAYESVARKAFVYQSLSVADLNAYADVIESDAGQKMYDAVEGALSREFHSQMREFAAALGDAVGAEDI